MRAKGKRKTKGMATHARLLDHGLRVASEVGLAGVSIGPLAADAGLGKSSFFAHFATKEALQVSLLEAAAGRFGDAVLIPAATVPAGVARLRRVFELWLEWPRRAGLPGDPFIVAVAEFDRVQGPVRDRLVSLQQVWMQALAGYAQDAVNAGEIHRETDPQQLAFEIVGTYLTYQWMMRLLRDPAAAKRAKSAFERLLLAPPLRSVSRATRRVARKAPG